MTGSDHSHPLRATPRSGTTTTISMTIKLAPGLAHNFTTSEYANCTKLDVTASAFPAKVHPAKSWSDQRSNPMATSSMTDFAITDSPVRFDPSMSDVVMTDSPTLSDNNFFANRSLRLVRATTELDWGRKAWFKTQLDPTRWVKAPFAGPRHVESEQGQFMQDVTLGSLEALEDIRHSVGPVGALVARVGVLAALVATLLALTLVHITIDVVIIIWRATIIRHVARPATPTIFQIFVKTLSGKTIVLDVFASDTIRNLKIMISLKTGIPVDEQYLTFGGKPLKSRCTVVQYHLQKGSTLELNVRLCGGGRCESKPAAGAAARERRGPASPACDADSDPGAPRVRARAHRLTVGVRGPGVRFR